LISWFDRIDQGGSLLVNKNKALSCETTVHNRDVKPLFDIKEKYHDSILKKRIRIDDLNPYFVWRILLRSKYFGYFKFCMLIEYKELKYHYKINLNKPKIDHLIKLFNNRYKK